MFLLPRIRSATPTPAGWTVLFTAMLSDIRREVAA